MPMSAAQTSFRVEQPFAHIVVFDWYDGPVKGLARNATSDSSYYFTMLDTDEALECRAFAFYEIEPSLHDDCLRTLSAVEPPKYPVWCPAVAPDQVDFSQWTQTRRSQLRAVLICTRFMEHLLAVHVVDQAGQVDVREWDFDEEVSTFPWVDRLLGTVRP